MRSLRAAGTGALLSAVLVGAAACSSSDDPTGAAGSSSSSPAPSASAGESGSVEPSASAAPSGSPTSPANSSPANSSPAAPPTLAGRSEAQAVDSLPAGHALGTAVLTYSGVGEVSEPFEGECWHEGDTTRIQGAAETAVIRLAIGPDGARLALEDVGLSATSLLTTGRYEVDGIHLSLAAGLTQDGERVGTVELEIDCSA